MSLNASVLDVDGDLPLLNSSSVDMDLGYHPTSWKVWLSAFGFVTVINLSSVMGILFFPLMNKSFYTVVMRTMIGLAIGSLSGSALFHLIPAAFGLDNSTDKEAKEHLNIALVVWCAAWIVMMLECAIKIGVKMRSKAYEKAEVEDADGNEDDLEKKPMEMHGLNGLQNGAAQGHGSEREMSIHSSKSKSRETLPVHRSTLSLSRIKALSAEVASPQQIKTVAWIIIIGDSLHNFIDGVSIGTSFAKSFNTGAIISVAIMCEEFPHELGDFAILINSGMSVKKALLVNFLSALTCYLGMILGIILGKIEWDHYIFAFAAGIFLYVALGDMIPEVTTLTDEVSEICPKLAVRVLLNHCLGIATGIIIMYLLAYFSPPEA